MADFTCPFCGCRASTGALNMRVYSCAFSYDTSSPYIDIGNYPHVEISIFRCPNPDCEKESVFADGKLGYMENRRVMIYPDEVYRKFPDYVPEAIRSDYEEACLIKTRSPKAAAALARRCLQGMIRDFWGIKGSNLYEEIQKLQGKIPASQWKAIDALRQLGNIGAHMEADTSLIVSIDPEEAEKLVQLVELLLDKWYVARNDEETLYGAITGANAAAQNKRHRSDKLPRQPEESLPSTSTQ